ncbi:MAG TPA: hypothetical protein VKD90_26565 [Gemmataceae bacterium]|nr:hypothetical protein [Gemmataceae bacterium]
MWAVIWRDTALNELADDMVRADLPTQDLIARQVEALNRRLATDPLNEGESRTGRVRVAFADPVGILFTVSEIDQVVWVTHFWTY